MYTWRRSVRPCLLASGSNISSRASRYAEDILIRTWVPNDCRSAFGREILLWLQAAPTSSELHKTPAGIFFRKGLVCRHFFPKFQEHDREVIIKGVLAVEGTHILFNYVNDLIASQGLYGIMEALNETFLAVLLT